MPSLMPMNVSALRGQNNRKSSSVGITATNVIRHAYFALELPPRLLITVRLDGMAENRSVKILSRILLGVVILASIALAAFLLHGLKEKETWATLTGLLAVIAAAIGALPAIRLLEIQEDALRPRPTPYFDLTSRYDLLQLRIKNLGAGVAYDIHLKWKNQPVDHKGEKITSLDYVSVLLPQESASTLVGTAHSMVKTIGDTRFEGECSYKDCTGKKIRQKFVCSVDANQKQLVHNDEIPKTLYELQQVPEQIGRIADVLETFKPQA